MKNLWVSEFERKIFCLIMDLPESNSREKIECKVRSNVNEDYYSF